MEICSTMFQAKSFIRAEAASEGKPIPDGCLICHDAGVGKWVTFNTYDEYEELNDPDLVVWCTWKNGKWAYNLPD